MAALVLAVNPIIATIGQISAIIICLFIFIFVLLAVAFNLAMAFGLGWVREKANLIKMLRPVVDSVNHASERAAHGSDPAENKNPVVRAVATVPAQMNTIDKKVEETTDRVANAAIEGRARVEQGKAVVKAFFRRKPTTSAPLIGQSTPELRNPAHQALPDAVPVVSVEGASNGYRRDDTSQLRDVPAR
ncbi:MAG: hypothetical protein H0U76_15080 [Ktedonobacteraceae bacterium]|nr:hypothetical protein [Ktedonobacteraceae bacterium]